MVLFTDDKLILKAVGLELLLVLCDEDGVETSVAAVSGATLL